LPSTASAAVPATAAAPAAPRGQPHFTVRCNSYFVLWCRGPQVFDGLVLPAHVRRSVACCVHAASMPRRQCLQRDASSMNVPASHVPESRAAARCCAHSAQRRARHAPRQPRGGEVVHAARGGPRQRHDITSHSASRPTSVAPAGPSEPRAHHSSSSGAAAQQKGPTLAVRPASLR
jgi:hypothetical protein